MTAPEHSDPVAYEELAGLRLPDPYRWLEGHSDDVRRWQQEQNVAASTAVREWPGFAHLRERVAHYLSAAAQPLPRRAGHLWFRSEPSGSQEFRIVATPTPFGDGRSIFESSRLAPGAVLSWLAPSPDGQLLALGLCRDGSEQNTITLIDVPSEALLPSPSVTLMDGWSGGVSWLHDSSGFYATVLDGPAVDLSQQVILYDVDGGTTARIDVPWQPGNDYRMVQPSWDGQTLLAYQGLNKPLPIAIAPLDAAAAPRWKPFLTSSDSSLAGHLIDGRYLAITDLDAPRGRVVAVSPESPEPEHWVTLVPESDAVLRTLTPVQDLLYVTELLDTYARVRVIDRTGRVLGEVALPGAGALGEQPFAYMSLVPRGDRDSFLFSFSTLTRSWGTYQHVPGTTWDEVVELQRPTHELHDATIEDHWATSRDGTLVPYHVVSRAPVTEEARPTLLYGYGGFNVALLPQFPGPIAAFIEAGGVYVHTHVRGGGELGRQWWEGARFAHKQNSYDDLYAIAEDLISNGTASPATLAVTGGSNGGLMCGVAITQRPELWAAAVARVPLLDLAGACRDNYGRLGISLEFADVDDPEDVQRMLTFSPYHLVEDRSYPAVFLDAGDTDPRCPPWHARKFGARLQAAQRGPSPVHVRIWDNVGHGWATARDAAVEQHSEWLAFVCQHTGIAELADRHPETSPRQDVSA